MRRQRGIALVTAMLITALAVSAVAGLFWRQQVQVRTLENLRLHVQMQWVLRAGLDWTKSVLREDSERFPEFTTLDGPWNRESPEIRLDHYLEREVANSTASGAADSPISGAGRPVSGAVDSATSPAAILSRVVDAQSRFNLANLASERTLNLAEIRTYERLLTALGLDPSLALRTAQVLAAGQPGEPTRPRRAALNRLDELQGIAGYTPQVLTALANFVVLLPTPADLNLDTAAPEVLAAVTGLSLPEARQLADRRRQAYFRTLEEVGAALPDRRVLEGLRVGLRSDYFLVENRIRLDRAALDTVSLLYRPRGGTSITELVWTREL